MMTQEQIESTKAVARHYLEQIETLTRKDREHAESQLRRLVANLTATGETPHAGDYIVADMLLQGLTLSNFECRWPKLVEEAEKIRVAG